MKSTKKELLLEAAKELFAEFGYTDTTFKKISEKAGVALGLLTHHYGNKEKLFLAAGLDVLDELHRRLQQEMSKASTGLDSVKNYAECYFDFAADKETNFLVLVRCSPFSDLKASEDRDVMIKSFAVLYDDLESCIARGIGDGSIRKELPPRETAVAVFCNLVGGVRHMLLTPYGEPSTSSDVTDFILRSLEA
ncbi:MAG TPA: TetR/AcrR family transcriptional regulator [Tichowtungia sp.]|nr:TetR/AcrR family transcriptional regulator [Tichowtungia sp.]